MNKTPSFIHRKSHILKMYFQATFTIIRIMLCCCFSIMYLFMSFYVAYNITQRIMFRFNQNSYTFCAGDRVIFAESPSAPGVPVVYRTPDERSSNPDRLNLDRYASSCVYNPRGNQMANLMLSYF